ncbi:MAG TPA: AAA family ATPase, partial [Geminicoccaceae bacterium]|nr:AAA family ATPase [Geminicoccaceae bacterium]
MYETFFGLKQKPFSLLPDPRFLYASRTHETALSLLEYGLAEQAGFVVLTGEVGTGKTTLLRHLLHLVKDEVIVGLVTNTHRSFGDLMRWILLAFDVNTGGSRDQVEAYQTLLDLLIARYAEGRRCVLIIDEAQNLSEEALEQLRMLSNINSEADHLLQLILVGQPELREVLKRPELRQFVQRIAIDYHLQPLSRDEVIDYIAYRLLVGGASRPIFTYEACVAVHYFSHGIPRLVNNLCDLGLVHAYAEDLTEVDIDTVINAVQTRAGGGLAAFAALPEAPS